ncbi:MAG: hypothetical protein ACE14M_16020 [Terriglobales bacterium]
MRRAILTAVVAAALLGGPGVLSHAQIHGVPPSVTSPGPAGLIPAGPAASVTSLGPKGFFGGFSTIDKTFIGGGRVRFGHRHFRNKFGPFFGPVYPAYYPYIGYYEYDPYAYPAEMNPYAAAEPVEPEPPAATIFEHRATPAQPAKAPPPEPTPVPAKAEPVEPQPTTILVFRDGHRLEVRNYAIMGDTLINLSDNGPRRISLKDLDVETTAKINDERGVEFRLPQKAS